VRGDAGGGAKRGGWTRPLPRRRRLCRTAIEGSRAAAAGGGGMMKTPKPLSALCLAPTAVRAVPLEGSARQVDSASGSGAAAPERSLPGSISCGRLRTSMKA
jgi:hypothetical protein